MSDNTLTGCWRLEQVGQHSSDEDDLFSSMKSRRSEGTGELEGYLACVSVNMDLLNAFQNIKKQSLKLNTHLPAPATCTRLLHISRYSGGVRRVLSLCLSQYGSAERLSEYQKTVPETQYWPTCLGHVQATLQLCWIAVPCKASLNDLHSS